MTKRGEPLPIIRPRCGVAYRNRRASNTFADGVSRCFDGSGAFGASPAPVRPDEACHLRSKKKRETKTVALYTRGVRTFRATGRRFALAESGTRRWLHSRSRWSEHFLYLFCSREASLVAYFHCAYDARFAFHPCGYSPRRLPLKDATLALRLIDSLRFSFFSPRF